MEFQATDDQPIDEEVAFWRGFIAWWAREKATPVPARAWEALKRAQRRSCLTDNAQGLARRVNTGSTCVR